MFEESDQVFQKKCKAKCSSKSSKKKKKLKKNARDKAHDKGSRKMQRSRSPTLTRGEIEQERKKPSKCSCDKSREKSSEFSEVGRVNQILFVLIGEEKPSKCS